MSETVGTAAQPPLTTRQALWPVIPLLVGIGLLMGASGLQSSLVSLRASFEGFRGLEIGVIASSYFAGFLAGAKLGTAWIRRVGHVRAFAAFASIASIMVLLHVLAISVPVWIVARLLTGVCLAGLLVTIESWLNRSAPRGARGRVLSVYMVVNVAAYAVGQLLLVVAPIESFELFAIVSVMLSAALLPVILSRRAKVEVVEVLPLPLRRLVERAPAAAVASAMAGLAWGAIAGWSPVVAARLGLRGIEVTAFIGLFMVGHLLIEPLVGSVSDRFDRRLILTTIASLGTGAAALGVLAGTQATLLILLGILIGALTLPMYSLSIAVAGDNLEPQELVAASGALVRINGVGAASGPLLAAAATAASISGFYVLLAAGSALTAVAGTTLLLRAGYRPPRVPYIGMIARGSNTATRLVVARTVGVTRRRRDPSEGGSP